jgi:hypothetical protein
MRLCLLCALTLGCALGSLAQELKPLALSQSLIAIKLKAPQRQLTTFAPVLDLLEGVSTTAMPPGQPLAGVRNLRQALRDLAAIPGTDPTGEFWLAVMPPPAIQPPAKPGPPPFYLIVPLAKPEAFREFLTAAQADPKRPVQGSVIGTLGVLSPNCAVPATLPVALDLPLTTTREVAVSVQVANLAQLPSPEVEGIGGEMLAQMRLVMADVTDNVARWELGVAMVGPDLSLESFTLAKPASPLAGRLQAAPAAPPTLPMLDVLPSNLAYCGASGPALPGVPTFTRATFRLVTGMLSIFLPPDKQAQLQGSLTRLLAQCDQGRVIGLTAPPVSGPGGSTLVALYQLQDAKGMQEALPAFFADMHLARDSFLGGILADVFTFSVTPNHAQLAPPAQPATALSPAMRVDRLSITVTPPAAPGAPGAAPAAPRKAFNFEGRLGYWREKMFLVAGHEQDLQLKALYHRLLVPPTDGFTSTPRYQALRAQLPAKTLHGYECFATLDLCRVFAHQIPDEKQRTEALKGLSFFPPQRSVIYTYQELQPGRVRGEICLPAEQLNFLYTLTRFLQESRQKPGAPPAK